MSALKNTPGPDLYLLSPNCSWCTRNQNNINAVALARSDKYYVRFSNVENTKIAEYVESSNLPFPLYSIASSRDTTDFHFEGTPQTALILSNGIVKHVWVGAFDNLNLHAIEGFFLVKLPGLRSLVRVPTATLGREARK